MKFGNEKTWVKRGEEHRGVSAWCFMFRFLLSVFIIFIGVYRWLDLLSQ